MIKKLKTILDSFIHTLESCYLCIKYPFLYPRNRWTGNHWDSWILTEYLHGKRAQYTCTKGEDGVYRQVKVKDATEGLYDKAFKTVDEWEDSTQYIHDVIKSYPWFIWYKIVYFIANWFLPIFHCIPTYTELDAMPEGWRKAFGIQMCDEIKGQLKKEGNLYSYRIIQIKEKFAELCWYDAGSSSEVSDIIDKYAKLSYKTCINCGKPATHYSTGWILPLCDNCYKKQ